MKQSSKWIVFGALLNSAALLCWLLMFMAGTDVWHDTGSQDFWTLQGQPYNDLRAFAWAFYGLFVILIASFSLQLKGLFDSRK